MKKTIIRKSLMLRLAEAIDMAPSIAVTRDNLDKVVGFKEGYLDAMGLSKQDLKRLERAGLALRGYARFNKKRNEHTRVWVILKEGNTNGETETGQGGTKTEETTNTGSTSP